jgi:two-component system response regulator PilR (NtrC family)
VRELENILERSVVLTGGGALDAGDLRFESSPQHGNLLDTDDPASATPAVPIDEVTDHAEPRPSRADVAVQDGLPSNLEVFLDAQEAEILRLALARTRNNRTEAAQLLGLSLRQIRYRLQRLGIR